MAGDTVADGKADSLATASVFQLLHCSLYVIIAGLQNFICVIFKLLAEYV